MSQFPPWKQDNLEFRNLEIRLNAEGSGSCPALCICIELLFVELVAPGDQPCHEAYFNRLPQSHVFSGGVVELASEHYDTFRVYAYFTGRLCLIQIDNEDIMLEMWHGG